MGPCRDQTQLILMRVTKAPFIPYCFEFDHLVKRGRCLKLLIKVHEGNWSHTSFALFVLMLYLSAKNFQ